jgi:dihydrolipoamide dehydrogenase
MSDKQYDLVVIGGGPGGYVAAIRAAQLGMKTACVEGRGALGGTCLNVGCIPSKALLHSSEKYADASKHFAEHGIKVEGLSLDLATMMARKDKVVKDLTTGIEFLFKKNKIDYLKGWGTIPAVGSVKVKLVDGGEETLAAKQILIATGSESTPLPGVETDEKQVVTSTGALALDKLPGKMVVIGAGVIGLEMGSVWSRLGAEVTVVEFLDRILPGMDGEIGKQTQRVLGKQGLKFKLGTKVTAAKAAKGGVTLTLEPAKGGDGEEMKTDVVLVAIGRRPFTEGLGLKELGVEVDKRGVIQVDDGADVFRK